MARARSTSRSRCRSAAISPTCSRRGACRARSAARCCRRRSTAAKIDLRLSRASTTRTRRTELRFEPEPERVDREGLHLRSSRWRAANRRTVVLLGRLPRRSDRRSRDLLQGVHGGQPAREGGDAQRRHGRDLERDLQRGDVPLDGRPLHADHRDAAGPLSLCGHALVFDDLRPRRDHHGAADAVARSDGGAGRAEPPGPLPGDQLRRCRPTPSPARSCTRCAAAKWPRCAKCPFGLYYGTIDATPLFVVLAGRYLERTGDLDVIRDLWPAIERALAWMDESGDRDGDGFLEYARADRCRPAEPGLEGFVRLGLPCRRHARPRVRSRSWKCRAMPTRPSGWPRSARAGSASSDRADALDRQATALAERFEDAFWCEEIGTYAIALDGEKKPCRVRTSNAGQVLWTGIARPDRAQDPGRRAGLARLLLRLGHPHGGARASRATIRCRIMTARSGRTTTSLIACGMARYGLASQAERVFEGLFAAASYMDLRRLPELFCGFRRRRGAAPTLYPVACCAAGLGGRRAFHAAAGLARPRFDPEQGAIRFRNPRLPAFLDEITIRNLGFRERQSRMSTCAGPTTMSRFGSCATSGAVQSLDADDLMIARRGRGCA